MDKNGQIPLFQNPFTRSSRIIHTPSAFARSALLYLQEVGSLQALAPHVNKRYNLPSYLFFVVTKGEGQLTYDGVTYQLHQNDCVFIDCRKAYEQGASDHRNEAGEFDALWSLSWIHFDGPTMGAIYEKYKERGGRCVFSTNHAEAYRALISTLLNKASTASYTCDMEIAEKLTAVLTLLMEDAWDSDQEAGIPAPKRSSVVAVKAFLDEHYCEQLSLENLAKIFYINKQYLARIFKEQYGLTVNGYLARVRITKAKSLLRFSNMTVEEIGAQVGIPDPNYFARTFKKIEGTPLVITEKAGISLNTEIIQENAHTWAFFVFLMMKRILC